LQTIAPFGFGMHRIASSSHDNSLSSKLRHISGTCSSVNSGPRCPGSRTNQAMAATPVNKNAANGPLAIPQDACHLGIMDLRRISGTPEASLATETIRVSRNPTIGKSDSIPTCRRSLVLILRFLLKNSKVERLSFHVSQMTGESASSEGWGAFVTIFVGFADVDVGPNASRSAAVTKVDFQGVAGGHS
jgi:hypothetical protein